MIAGHFVVGILVLVFDVSQSQAVTAAPRWDEESGHPLVYLVYLFARIVLINSVLMPVSVLGLMGAPFHQLVVERLAFDRAARQRIAKLNGEQAQRRASSRSDCRYQGRLTFVRRFRRQLRKS